MAVLGYPELAVIGELGSDDAALLLCFFLVFNHLVVSSIGWPGGP